MEQITIAKSVEAVGIGLHKGTPVRLRLEPLPEDSGIVFYRSDIALSIPLAPGAVVDTKMATVIGDPQKGFISTIEHFLSALYAYGIDNIRVVVDSNEMPIMDGSAISFCLLLDEAGIKKQSKPKRFIRIKKPIEIKDGKKFVALRPSKEAVFDFEIKFDHPAIGRQSQRFVFDKEGFLSDIARARTFGFAHEMQMLQANNLALGASLENAIGLDETRILNPEGLRYDNEFVRHKILDAMGDMMVSGYRIMGSYESFAGSHHLNHLLTQELLNSSDAYEIVELEALAPQEAKSYAFS